MQQIPISQKEKLLAGNYHQPNQTRVTSPEPHFPFDNTLQYSLFNEGDVINPMSYTAFTAVQRRND